MWNYLFLNDYGSNRQKSNTYIILHKMYNILELISSSSFTLQIYLYQQINTISYHLYHNTPIKHLVLVLSLTCKNTQYISYTKKHAIILYYYSMFHTRVYLHFQKLQSFPQGRDVFHSNVNHQI